MSSKKHYTIITIFVIIIMTIIPAFSYANEGENIFKNYIGNNSELANENNLITAGGELIDFVIYCVNLLQIIGAAVAVIMVAVFGFKFFTMGPQQKAGIKTKAYTYLLGIFLLLGGPLLMRLVISLIQLAIE